MFTLLPYKRYIFISFQVGHLGVRGAHVPSLATEVFASVSETARKDTVPDRRTWSVYATCIVAVVSFCHKQI